MRIAAVVSLLLVAALPSASGILARQIFVYAAGTQATATIGREHIEPGAPGGATPVDKPVGTDQGGNMPETDLAKVIAQLGAIGILAVVLFFYRRDFFRKFEDQKLEASIRDKERQEEKDQLASLVEKSTAAITNSAIATSRQTDATHRLARTVENLERRQAGLPPAAGTPGGV